MCVSILSACRLFACLCTFADAHSTSCIGRTPSKGSNGVRPLTVIHRPTAYSSTQGEVRNLFIWYRVVVSSFRCMYSVPWLTGKGQLNWLFCLTSSHFVDSSLRDGRICNLFHNTCCPSNPFTHDNLMIGVLCPAPCVLGLPEKLRKGEPRPLAINHPNTRVGDCLQWQREILVSGSGFVPPLRGVSVHANLVLSKTSPTEGKKAGSRQ